MAVNTRRPRATPTGCVRFLALSPAKLALAGSIVCFVVGFAFLWNWPHPDQRTIAERFIVSQSNGRIAFESSQSKLMAQDAVRKMKAAGVLVDEHLPVFYVETVYTTSSDKIPLVQNFRVIEWPSYRLKQRTGHFIQNGKIVHSWAIY